MTIVVDVLRATSTIVQALDSGYERVFCCSELDEARSLRDALGDAVLAGERGARPIEGFDLGNSPREFVEPRARAVVLTTTNGTRAVAAAAAAGSESVLIGSLLNADAVAEAAQAAGVDSTIVCAGVDGAFALDDAYCAGRIAEAIGAARTDAAEAAVILARSFARPEDALRAAQNPRQEGLGDDEIAWCARVDVTAVVPRLVALRGSSAELRA
jgi:2-phosphosulfolactate phosphatase